MRLILRGVSVIGLALTLIPSVLVLLNVISWNLHADLMTAGMIVWFATAPGWMRPSRQ